MGRSSSHLATTLKLVGCAVFSLGGCSTKAAEPSVRASAAAPPATIAAAAATSSAIGTAKLESDGTLLVTLYTRGGLNAQSLKRYKKGDPERATIISHLGGITVGEEKLVPPWPDNIDDARVNASVAKHVASKAWAKDARITITGTDQKKRIAVTVVDPSSKQGLALLLDPGTYDVVDEQPLKR